MTAKLFFSDARLSLFLLWLVIALQFHPLVSKGQDTLHIYENYLVEEGEVLEINPGTVVLFHGFYNITVEGSLMVLGTEELPVLFTASDTTQLYNTHVNEGGWNGIRVLETVEGRQDGLVMLSHTTLEFSKASKQDFEHGGAISIYGERDVIIQNCLFRYNYAYRRGGALYLERNNGYISHCTFENNTAHNFESEIWPYGGGVATMNSKAEISWSVFRFNGATGMGGGLNVESSHVWLHNNIFQSNDAPLGGGIGVVRSNSSNTFSNNLIIDNTAMYFGGGIAFVEGAVVVANTNILNNNAGYGGALYFNSLSCPKFYNSVIRGNRMYPDTLNQVWIFDAVSAPEFYNCNIEGGFEGFYGSGGDDFPGVYQDNIDEPPLFADEPNMDFSLLEESPCRDGGYPLSADLGIFPLDLAGNNRFSGMYVDMGACEFQDPHAYYGLTIQAQGQGNTLPDTGEYMIQEGTAIEIQAIPEDGWYFDHWLINDQIIPDQVYTVEVLTDTGIMAIFLPGTSAPATDQQKLYVYPNPSTGKVILSLEYGQCPGNCILNIRSFQGLLLETLQLQEVGKPSHTTIDISGYSAGLLFLELISETNIYVAKIIKR